MAASGMRYKKMMTLISDINSIKNDMEKDLKRLQDERNSEVAKSYGGEAAENFKSNVDKATQVMLEQITDLVNKLTTEAETQHDAYIAQEQRLKSQLSVQ